MRLNLNLSVPHSPQSLKAKLEAGNKLDEHEKERVRKVAGEFESLLLEKLVKNMRATVPESGLLGDNPGQDIFKEMLDGEYASLMERRGGIGIADYMAKHMTHGLK
ncbi:MAG: rod-binding protein [Deltaproteobacteria bacterium]|nr:rod-binding protein [Deltaproteobacteria bacterium]